MPRNPELDIVLFGATGYTGRLVVDYLMRTYVAAGTLALGLAGRSLAKLEELRDQLNAEVPLPLIVADADSPATLAAMVRRTNLVLTTVGPYAQSGEALVAACVDAGCDYLDLTGEAHWLRAMIDKYDAKAKQSGARILSCCGYDSIPAEMGVWACQRAAMETYGAPLRLVKARHRAYVTRGASGGSWATGQAVAAAVARDKSIINVLTDPFALTPGFQGVPQPLARAVEIDPDVGAVMPFCMAGINTSVVHRSNMLMGFPYGRDFVYSDMMMADMAGFTDIDFNLSDGSVPADFKAPAPGEGPPGESRKDGRFDTLFIGIGDEGRRVKVSVKGDADPGYESTAKIIAETALCLLASPEVSGGLWTPVAALGEKLTRRLADYAGVTIVQES